MAGKFVALMAGAAVLGMVGVASASEPISLTDVQLDQISAGAASVSASLRGNANVTGTYSLTNRPGVSSAATINANITPVAPFGLVAVATTAVANTTN